MLFLGRQRRRRERRSIAALAASACAPSHVSSRVFSDTQPCRAISRSALANKVSSCFRQETNPRTTASASQGPTDGTRDAAYALA